MLELLELFPDAEIYTSVYDPEPWPAAIRPGTVHTSFLDRLPGRHARHYPRLLPLMNTAFESFDLDGYDLVLSSNHSCAKNVITAPGHAARLLLPHADALRLGSRASSPGRSSSPAERAVLPLLLSRLRRQDADRRRRAPTSTWPTRATWPRASASTTGGTRRSSTRRWTSRRCSTLPRARRRATTCFSAGSSLTSGPTWRVGRLRPARPAAQGRRRRPRRGGPGRPRGRPNRVPRPGGRRGPRPACSPARARCCFPARRTSGSCRWRPRRPACR